MIYTTNILKAIKFAAKTHNQYQQQKRKGKEIPYISHPLTVGIILSLIQAPEEVVVAGILHDTIEDSIDEKKVTPEMIEERFGNRVAELVLSVTEENKDLPWEDRKKDALDHIKNFSKDSALVKSADVISNLRELIDDYQRYGEDIFERFNASKEMIISHQLKVVDALLNVYPDSPLKDDLDFVASNISKLFSEDK